MSWWEGEEEQISECGRSDSVWERLRNQPIHSPPSSPSSGKVFLTSPQPPPLTSQLHFSPPPTTSDLMSPYLDFSPPRSPPPQFFPIYPDCENDFQFECDNVTSMIVALGCRYISAQQKVTEWMRLLCDSSKPILPRNIEDSLRDLTSTREAALKYLNTISSTRSTLVTLVTLIAQDDTEEVLYTLLRRRRNSTQHARASPRLIASTDIGEIRQCHSSKPLKRNLEDSLRDFGSTREAALKYLNKLLWWLPLKLNTGIPNPLMTQLLSCPGEFISQTKDCSLVEERSVEITVEVDATNNGAHGVKAYENFPIVSHSENKNTRDKLKRNYKSISVITQKDLEQNFGRSREDVANSFGVSVSTLKRICRKHRISRWPFQSERKKESSMEVISPSMHEKHDSRLRCIQTPLHVRSSPRTIDLLDGGEMVQLDSSKQQSLVEFDVTNNSAHLVRASQSCSTISHSDETNSRETLKRKCTSKSVLSFEDLQPHFDCKRDNAAKALGVSVSTVKRICRQHGISRWPSRKKKNVSKTDYRLVEPQGEKDVSPTCSKMPTDGQTERGNEMVGHLQDQNEGLNLSNTENGSIPVSEMDCILLGLEGEKNVSPTYKTPTVGIVLDCKEGPNLSNIENHSNEESTTTSIFQDSVPVFERDCVLHEPQGEKNESPTHKTPTNGQTEVGNGMVGHIQDQNGIVPEFIEGPNLSNAENCSNEKSLTIPNFQDSVPGTYPAMDSSISSIYRESGEAGGSSELAFQPNELTPSMAYPNPNACVHTEPHISLTEMPIENVGSSRDSRNFSTSAVGIFMGGHVSESSWTMPLPSNLAPMQTMATIPYTMPHLTEKQDITTVTFKARYRDDTIRFCLSPPSGIVELKKEVTNRLGELGSFKVDYQDNNNEWILIGCDTDVWDCFKLSSSSGDAVVRLRVRDEVANSKNSNKSSIRLKSKRS